MAELVASIFDEEEAYVAQGGVEVAKELLDTDLTISSSPGRPPSVIVMAAASKNLTSVTLELGGKALQLLTTAPMHMPPDNMPWAKFTNAGQICIAPDHVYVHEAKLEDFKKGSLRPSQASTMTNLKSNDFVQIANEGHWNRLRSL